MDFTTLKTKQNATNEGVSTTALSQDADNQGSRDDATAERINGYV
jgi:hypothetical protein